MTPFSRPMTSPFWQEDQMRLQRIRSLENRPNLNIMEQIQLGSERNTLQNLRSAALRESQFSSEEEAEQIRRSLRQKEAERLAKEESKREEDERKEKMLAEARVPAKYRDGRGRPFSDVTIANIESGVYRDPSLPLPKRRMFEFFNKQDDPEEWEKKVAGVDENIRRYREEMREKENESRRSAGLPPKIYNKFGDLVSSRNRKIKT